MSVDKKVKYEVQGGVKNYLPSEMVTVPKKAKSSPKHPETELAYITKAEKNLLIKKNLHGSLKGKVNKGPGGIMSLNGDYSDMMSGVTGADISAAERGEGPRGAMSPSDAQDFRSAAINAGAGRRVNPGFFDSKNVISPAELAAAKKYRMDPSNKYSMGAYRNTRGGGLSGFISGGGITGGIIRGLGQALGFGKQWNEPTYDMSGYNSLGLGGTGQEGFGVPTTQGDYDVLGNKIDEITGEITSPDGTSLGFLEGYPGQKKGIETIPTGDGGSREYVDLIEKYIIPLVKPSVSDVELNDGAFESRFLNNVSKEEKAKIEKQIMEKFTGPEWNYSTFGLKDMDGS